jgi:hypothetical protein
MIIKIKACILIILLIIAIKILFNINNYLYNEYTNKYNITVYRAYIGELNEK